MLFAEISGLKPIFLILSKEESAMTSLRLWIRLMGVLGLLIASSFPLPAQETAPEESFGESINVSVVNLEVFVTDKKGKPILGLKKEDFEVLEDGQPVAVTNFYAENRLSAESPVGAPAETQTAAERPEDQRLRLVVFVDDVNMEPQGRNRILPSLAGFLRGELAPGDEVMLIRYDQKLDIRRQFTTDLGQIEADIAALKGLSSDTRKFEESREHAIEDIESAMVGNGMGLVVQSRIGAWADQESASVRGALDGLDSVVSWLAGMPGRKAILYVSDGLALNPGDDLLTQVSLETEFKAGHRASGFAGGQYDLTNRFWDLTARASRNRVTLYPIEAYGSRAVSGTIFHQALVMSRQNGLRLLAKNTGGRPMLNASNPLAALQLMGEDLTAYYSLGYQPQRPGDGKEHKVEVRVKARGAQVRHRQWYRDKPLGETVAERTLAVMRFGPEDNPLSAAIEIGAGKELGDSTVLVPVKVRVPLGKLYLQPGEQGSGKRSGRLRLYIVASGGGATTPVRQTKLVTVEIPEAEGETKGEYVHEIAIPMKKGIWAVGVSVRDELAATTSYLRKEFVIGEGEAGR
jgi:VWFA-related protein